MAEQKVNMFKETNTNDESVQEENNVLDDNADNETNELDDVVDVGEPGKTEEMEETENVDDLGDNNDAENALDDVVDVGEPGETEEIEETENMDDVGDNNDDDAMNALDDVVDVGESGETKEIDETNALDDVVDVEENGETKEMDETNALDDFVDVDETENVDNTGDETNELDDVVNLDEKDETEDIDNTEDIDKMEETENVDDTNDKDKDDDIREVLHDQKEMNELEEEEEIMKDEMNKTFLVEIDKQSDLEDLVFNYDYFNSIGVSNIQISYEEYGNDAFTTKKETTDEQIITGGKEEQSNTRTTLNASSLPLPPSSSSLPPTLANSVSISPSNAPQDVPHDLNTSYEENQDSQINDVVSEQPTQLNVIDASISNQPTIQQSVQGDKKENNGNGKKMDEINVSLPYSYFSYFFKRMQNKSTTTNETNDVKQNEPLFSRIMNMVGYKRNEPSSLSSSAKPPEDSLVATSATTPSNDVITPTPGAINTDNSANIVNASVSGITSLSKNMNSSIVNDEIKISANGKWVFKLECKNEPVLVDLAYIEKMTYEEKEDMLDSCIDQINQQKKRGAIINGIYKVDNNYVMIGNVVDTLNESIALLPLFNSTTTKIGTKLHKYKTFFSSLSQSPISSLPSSPPSSPPYSS
jgi:hypothetical protein